MRINVMPFLRNSKMPEKNANKRPMDVLVILLYRHAIYLYKMQVCHAIRP
jgi:hypothetical protein